LKLRPAALLARDVVADLPALAAPTAARSDTSKRRHIKNKKMSLLTHNRRSTYDNDS
jgi:hypothetical protein